MRLHDLRPAPGSHRPKQRAGRGISAGQGKTSGRGQKGQFARSSVGLPTGFEGGQMRLSQRLPKLRGFHNRFKRDFAVVNIGKLNRFAAGSVVDADTLVAAGLAGRTRDGIKVLSAGRLRVPLTVKVARISAAARAAVEGVGGSVELVAVAARSPRTTPSAAEADAAGDAVVAAGAAEPEDAVAAAEPEDAAVAPEREDAAVAPERENAES